MLDGQLSVAIPGVIDPLLRADASDLEVKSVCLYAWKAASRWFYNCNEDVGNTLKLIFREIYVFTTPIFDRVYIARWLHMRQDLMMKQMKDTNMKWM